MRRLRLLVLAALAGTAAPLGAQVVTTVMPVGGMPAVDQTTQSQDVQFRDDNQRMTVPVTFAGRGPFRFLVDTGADRTAISTGVVSRLGLAMTGTAQLHSVSGVQSVEIANVRQLQISGKTISSIDAPVLEAANMGADGVLGTDSLRAQRIQFDFKKNILSITPARHERLDAEPNTIVVEASRRAGRLIVTQAVADRQRLTVVLDTGSEICIGNEALRAALARKGVLRVGGTVDLLSVTGAVITGDHTVLNELKIGDVTLKNLVIIFADAHTFHQMNLVTKPTLLLGMNAMRAFDKVAIDFTNKTLRLLLPESGALDSVRLATR